VSAAQASPQSAIDTLPIATYLPVFTPIGWSGISDIPHVKKRSTAWPVKYRLQVENMDTTAQSILEERLQHPVVRLDLLRPQRFPRGEGRSESASRSKLVERL
jgi:hypothetical protein